MNENLKAKARPGLLDLEPADTIVGLTDRQLKEGVGADGQEEMTPDQAAEAVLQKADGGVTDIDLEDSDQREPYPPLRDQP